MSLPGQEAAKGTAASMPAPCWVWGVPFHPVTFPQAVAWVDELVRRRKPTYFVTANLNTVMLANQNPALRDAARDATFVVADGITLVWASRWKGTPVPERVTGSDLIYGLSELAARQGYGIYLLGGPDGVAAAAAAKLTERYPGLRVVGTACPPHRPLSPAETAELLETVRATRPDLLFVAFGQPKGELWIREHCEALGVPVCVQVGASLDFIAGRVRRAPRWVQRIHMETPYRILQEPRRLTPRYTKNALFLIRMSLRDVWNAVTRLGRRA